MRATRAATRARRKQKRPFVFECKISKKKLTREQKEALERLFLEAKWFYNAMISSLEGVFKFDTKRKTVDVLVQTPEVWKLEERELTLLSSFAKTGLIEKAKANIKTLSTLKKKREESRNPQAQEVHLIHSTAL